MVSEKSVNQIEATIPGVNYMIYHIYRNTKYRMPAGFDVLREQPMEGPELKAILWDDATGPVRENFDYAFALRTGEILKRAMVEPDSVTIVLDQAFHLENECRFDHFEEEWTRVLWAAGDQWREISVRNCAEDYSTWVQICWRDHMGTSEEIILEDRRISEPELLEQLPELKTLTAVSKLAR